MSVSFASSLPLLNISVPLHPDQCNVFFPPIPAVHFYGLTFVKLAHGDLRKLFGRK
ncbi:hypothetical protein [Sphingomonas turrisvirgatae]|uniref:hypothetical protein n=1 Tax=Sphingomonas turrisvirgatae TaxID=1888892 RepID=UPI0019D3F35D|nr:hypothetical protein [Sphingomonas turrisvirgatae]